MFLFAFFKKGKCFELYLEGWWWSGNTCDSAVKVLTQTPQILTQLLMCCHLQSHSQPKPWAGVSTALPCQYLGSLVQVLDSCWWGWLWSPALKVSCLAPAAPPEGRGFLPEPSLASWIALLEVTDWKRSWDTFGACVGLWVTLTRSKVSPTQAMCPPLGQSSRLSVALLETLSVPVTMRGSPLDMVSPAPGSELHLLWAPPSLLTHPIPPEIS